MHFRFFCSMLFSFGEKGVESDTFKFPKSPNFRNSAMGLRPHVSHWLVFEKARNAIGQKVDRVSVR